MKNLILSIALLGAGVLLAQNSSILVEINNIKNNNGNIALALYDNAKDFTKKEVQAIKSKAKKGKILMRFTDVPAGNYAVALLHDENANDKMDFNMLGVPKEDYAFSNNAKGLLAPPKFKAAAFKVGQNSEKRIKIDL